MLVNRWKLVVVSGLLSGALGCAGTGNKPATDGGPNLASAGQFKPMPMEKPGSQRPGAPEPEVRYSFFPNSKPPVKPIQPATYVASGTFRDDLADKQDLDARDRDDCRSQARQSYQQALARDPKYRPAMIAMAKSFAGDGDNEKAMEWYGRALQLNPKDATVWHEQGLTQARYKDFEGAAASMKQSVKCDPDNKKYQRTLGLTLARMGRADEAVAVLARCMSEAEARYTVARMMQHMDQGAMAAQQLQLAVKANPTFMAAHEMLREMQNGQTPIRAATYEEPAGQPMQPGNSNGPMTLPPVLIGGGTQ